MATGPAHSGIFGTVFTGVGMLGATALVATIQWRHDLGFVCRCSHIDYRHTAIAIRKSMNSCSMARSITEDGFWPPLQSRWICV